MSLTKEKMRHKTVILANSRSDQRCEERDQETSHPLGSGGHGHTFELESQWVCFRHNTVLTTGPGGGEEEDKQIRDEIHGVTDRLTRVTSNCVRAFWVLLGIHYL